MSLCKKKKYRLIPPPQLKLLSQILQCSLTLRTCLYRSSGGSSDPFWECNSVPCTQTIAILKTPTQKYAHRLCCTKSMHRHFSFRLSLWFSGILTHPGFLCITKNILWRIHVVFCAQVPTINSSKHFIFLWVSWFPRQCNFSFLSRSLQMVRRWVLPANHLWR